MAIGLAPAPVATPVYRCDTTLGAAVHAVGGGFLLAAGGALRHVDAAGRLLREVPLVPDGVDSRLNDGGTDPAGRYVVGSLSLDRRSGQERLWRLEHDGEVTVLDDDLTLSNGLGWSPDGGTFYSVDSVPGTVWGRNYDCESGRVGRRHRLFDIGDGTPDGLTVDADGNLWVAIWSRGECRCYTAAGEVIEVVTVGAPLATSCAFVNADLSTLLVTTAGKEVEGVHQTGEAGRPFVVDLPVTGQTTVPWKPPL